MNLATLVSSLVLAASTATAGLLVAPSVPLVAPQDDGSAFGIPLPALPAPFCIDSCGNKTADGNETAPAGNSTAPPPPPHRNETAPPPATNQTAPPKTCGVDLDDGQSVTGPSHQQWSWQVGAGTRNLTVLVEADGMWMPFGGGVRMHLTDGDGHEVASAEDSGSGVPFGYTAIHYEGGTATGLALGLWHLTAEANGVLGGISLHVHSSC